MISTPRFPSGRRNRCSLLRTENSEFEGEPIGEPSVKELSAKGETSIEPYAEQSEANKCSRCCEDANRTVRPQTNYDEEVQDDGGERIVMPIEQKTDGDEE